MSAALRPSERENRSRCALTPSSNQTCSQISEASPRAIVPAIIPLRNIKENLITGQQTVRQHGPLSGVQAFALHAQSPSSGLNLTFQVAQVRWTRSILP